MARKRAERLTKRQKKIKEKQQREEIERKKLLAEKITNEERIEVEYLKVERLLKERLSVIENFSNSIRKEYLTIKQKQKVLEELKNKIIQSRELLRKIYGMNFLYLKGKAKNEN